MDAGPAVHRGAQRQRVLLELAVWLALAATAFALSFRFSDEIGTYRWGPASWPRAIMLVMVVAALANAWRQWRGAESVAPLAESAEAWLTRFGLFLIPIVYVWLLPRTGFYVTTPVFLLVYLLYAGERRPGVILLVVLLVTGLLDLVFLNLFFIALPTGTWPGFYEANAWFVSVLS